MSLAVYQQKRNFKNTPEPEKSKATGKDKLIFVVQRHKASHLHYDFRLEMNGTLKSWAVPKGPSMNPGDKRLAMMVEDHPVSYAGFKGIIPEGNYGAGIVEIWDSGTYELSPVNKNGIQAIKDGSIKFTLKGKKLKGEFALAKIKNPTGKDNAWLLIKHRDEYATDEAYNSENLTPATSSINKALATSSIVKKSSTTKAAKKAAPLKKK